MDTNVLIAVAALGGVCVVLIIGLVWLSSSFRALKTQLVLLEGDGNEQDFVNVVALQIETARELGRKVALLESRTQDLRRAIARSVQRVGVVRYDAFEDMGGHLSFSAAFLDEHGTGVCLTCINGRTDARIYAKGVQQGAEAGVGLSSEESAAVKLAMEGESGNTPAAPRRVETAAHKA